MEGVESTMNGKTLVDGKTLVTRKGSNERMSGSLVKLSTDLE